MRRTLQTAGERIAIDSSLRWVDGLIEEAAAGELDTFDAGSPTLAVHVEPGNRPFADGTWEPLTRGAWRHRDSVVIEDACSSGFDVLVRAGGELPEFSFRWRPKLQGQATSRLLRSRFILLARAVLIQYPALWRAGLRGRAPLHASVCTAGDLQPMLCGPAGVGKSTLLTRELAAGGHAISDNICVSHGTTAWGLVEPLRIEGAAGRAMPHGRGEQPMERRATAMIPDLLVALRRGTGDVPSVGQCDASTVTRSLVTGTYMAGELRRFWGFAATVTAGAQLGPAHPPVEKIAAILAARLPSVEIVLAREPGVGLSKLLSRMEAIA
ncbi:MAG TPA: hypothetical protein VET26_06020 [Candidatus Sulfotelmatobacter sp.]|nr:hypothetical protein [Candidatus Sulfotelmatobacter sp.]